MTGRDPMLMPALILTGVAVVLAITVVVLLLIATGVVG
jgi:hypothetical protein